MIKKQLHVINDKIDGLEEHMRKEIDMRKELEKCMEQLFRIVDNWRASTSEEVQKSEESVPKAKARRVACAQEDVSLLQQEFQNYITQMKNSMTKCPI